MTRSAIINNPHCTYHRLSVQVTPRPCSWTDGMDTSVVCAAGNPPSVRAARVDNSNARRERRCRRRLLLCVLLDWNLKRINDLLLAGKPTRGPVHATRQDITEALKFLEWLWAEHGRTIADCTQQDRADDTTPHSDLHRQV